MSMMYVRLRKRAGCCEQQRRDELKTQY